MKRFRIVLLSCLLSVTMLFGACGNNNPDSTETGDKQNGQPSPFDKGSITVEEVTPVSADLSAYDFTYSNRDLDATVDRTNATKVVFSRLSASVSGSGATCRATDVTITQSGTYILSGNSNSGLIKVEAADTDKIQLVLDGLTLTNPNGPALLITSADKVFLTLAEGSTNMLADGELYIKTDNGTPLDAAIFSRADLTVNGSGTLQVNGNFKHGIVSKDDFVMTGGKVVINALYQGISGKDCVKLGGGELTVNAGTDGIRSDNDDDEGCGFVYISGGKLDITAENDAIQAETVLKLEGGEGKLTAGKGSDSQPSDSESTKGLKAKSDIVVSGGTFSVDASDDAINADGSVLISGGDITVSTANDAVKADLSLAITNGKLNIKKSDEGLRGQDVVISGGEVMVVASDDGIKAAYDDVAGKAAVLISGGTLTVNAEGDGIDVDGRLAVTGGVTLIHASSDAEKRSFEYETLAVVTGGTFVAFSGDKKGKNFTDSAEQCAIYASFSAQSANTTLSLCDADGNVLLSFTSANAYSKAVISAPDLQGNGTYKLMSGSTTLATFTLTARIQTVSGS